MPVKTLRDCAECTHVSLCDAHITGGVHKHREGVDPCVVVLDDKCKCPPGCMSDCAGCRYNWEQNDKEAGLS
jgi:hypothetical protein